jgi:hypothetical protein
MMSPPIQPAPRPFSEAIQRRLEKIMGPGQEPLAKLTAEQIASIQRGGAEDDCWEPVDALLIRLCDALQATSDVDDALWEALAAHFDAEAMLELLLLAGFYRTLSYLTNALRLPLEPWAARFAIN